MSGNQTEWWTLSLSSMAASGSTKPLCASRVFTSWQWQTYFCWTRGCRWHGRTANLILLKAESTMWIAPNGASFSLVLKSRDLLAAKLLYRGMPRRFLTFNTRLLAGIELYYIVILLVCDYLLKLSRCSASKWTRSLPPMLAAEGFWP